jgi:hypothetical protein
MWSADAASVKVWDQVEVKLPARFYGNYATNEDTGRKEFIFGVSYSFVIFGWLERAPQRFNKSPRRLLVRYLKSSLRSDGYRMVAKTEKLSGGRWRADFAGRSQGASYRRQVTIVPVRGSYLVATVSSPKAKWDTRLSAEMRAVVPRIRAL